MNKKPVSAMQGQHTPTPWCVGLYDATEDFKAIMTHVAVCRPDGSLLATCGPVDQASGADAAFIVRAVNAHEELLACAKLLLQLDDECQARPDKMNGLLLETRARVQQAVARAEGK